MEKGKRPEVISEYPLVSASQISLYIECPRKWAFRYLLKIQSPAHAAAALGTEVDDEQLQPLLMSNQPLDFTRPSGYIAASALAYLPQPQAPGLECQKHFVMPSTSSPGPDGKPRFAYQGYLDMWAPDASIAPDLPPIPVGTTIPFVGDFKTTSDFKWAKSKEDLALDVQATIYAKWAMWSTGASAVDLAWIYMRTKGSNKAQRTHLRTTDERVTIRFNEIDAVANEMFEVRTAAPPAELGAGSKNLAIREYIETLPPNIQACDAYGGCPYRGECNLSPAFLVDSMHIASVNREKRNAPKKKDQMPETPAAPKASLKDRLKNKKTTPAAVGETQPPAAATESVGINPPEKDLPPADPIGTVAEPPPVEDAPKPKGRPRKTAPADAPAPTPTAHTDEGKTYTVSSGEERYTNYGCGFAIPTFTITDTVRAGETFVTAGLRTYRDLKEFTDTVRALAKKTFDANKGPMGVKETA